MKSENADLSVMLRVGEGDRTCSFDSFKTCIKFFYTPDGSPLDNDDPRMERIYQLCFWVL